MDLGVVVFSGWNALTPPALAVALEERGFGSLFYPEHTHIPVRSTRPDGRPTRDYADSLDPFLALAAAAAVSTTLRLGTAVCLVPQRDPIITAKEVATLDQLSGGRAQFGVGAGWNREELADHGTDPRVRMAVLDERVRAMKAIWTADEAEFHGEYVDFDPLWSWPKPVQQPHPPVLVGGNGPGAEDRVLAIGDEWMPQCGPFEDVAEIERRVAGLRERAGHRMPVSLFGAIPRPDMIEAFAAAGVDRCLFVAPGTDRDGALSGLDELAALA